MTFNINYFADLLGNANLYRARPDLIVAVLEQLFNGLDPKSLEIVIINSIISSGNTDNVYLALAHLLRRANPIVTLGGGDTFSFAQASLKDMFAPFRKVNRDGLLIYSQGADVGEPEDRTDLVTPPVGFFSDTQTPPNVIDYQGKPHIIQTSRNVSSQGNSWARKTLDTFLAQNKGIIVLERNSHQTLDGTCISLQDGNLLIRGTSFGEGRYPRTFIAMEVEPEKYVKGNIAQMIPKYVGGYRVRPHIIDFDWDMKGKLEVIPRWTPVESDEYDQILKEQRKPAMELVGEQI